MKSQKALRLFNRSKARLKVPAKLRDESRIESLKSPCQFDAPLTLSPAEIFPRY